MQPSNTCNFLDEINKLDNEFKCEEIKEFEYLRRVYQATEKHKIMCVLEKQWAPQDEGIWSQLKSYLYDNSDWKMPPIDVKIKIESKYNRVICRIDTSGSLGNLIWGNNSIMLGDDVYERALTIPCKLKVH